MLPDPPQNYTNEPGLPPWPQVYASHDGVSVYGKAIDPDVHYKREKRLCMIVNIFLVAIIAIIAIYAFCDKGGLIWIKSLDVVDMLLPAVFFGFAGLLYMFGGIVIVNGIILLVYRILAWPWRLSSIRVDFTVEAIEIVSVTSGRVRSFPLNATKIEFHAEPHPWRTSAGRNAAQQFPDSRLIRFLDASVVNLVNGIEKVRLFSSDDEQLAQAFALCCAWALTHVNRNAPEPSRPKVD